MNYFSSGDLKIYFEKDADTGGIYNLYADEAKTNPLGTISFNYARDNKLLSVTYKIKNKENREILYTQQFDSSAEDTLTKQDISNLFTDTSIQNNELLNQIKYNILLYHKNSELQNVESTTDNTHYTVHYVYENKNLYLYFQEIENPSNVFSAKVVDDPGHNEITDLSKPLSEIFANKSICAVINPTNADKTYIQIPSNNQTIYKKILSAIKAHPLNSISTPTFISNVDNALFGNEAEKYTTLYKLYLIQQFYSLKKYKTLKYEPHDTISNIETLIAIKDDNWRKDGILTTQLISQELLPADLQNTLDKEKKDIIEIASKYLYPISYIIFHYIKNNINKLTSEEEIEKFIKKMEVVYCIDPDHKVSKELHSIISNAIKFITNNDNSKLLNKGEEKEEELREKFFYYIYGSDFSIETIDILARIIYFSSVKDGNFPYRLEKFYSKLHTLLWHP